MGVLEFQAVVMAGGRGTRLPELANDRPKCLLPVGPYPLIWYPLHMLQNHGFIDVLIVVIESQKLEIQQSLEKTPLKLKIEYATIPTDSDYGTAESLKHIKEKVKTDLLIVSCDTITNANLMQLLNDYRKYDASLAAWFFSSGAESGVTVPGPKNINKPERDLIGLDPNSKRILFVGSTSDFEDNLCLPAHLLRKHKRVSIHSNLIDAHVYVIKKWLIDYLAKSEGLSTLKGEFLPFVVKKQMSRSPKNNGSERQYPLNDSNPDDIFNFYVGSELDSKISKTSLIRTEYGQISANSNPIKCFATIVSNDTFSLRANTILGYCAANQKIFTHWDTFFTKSTISPIVSDDAIIHTKQIVECAVGSAATISKYTSLKRCVIGANCFINSNVRISDSVLMNGVIIEEGAVIENCVICDKVIVQSGSVLKHCLIGANFTVPINTQNEKVYLTSSDGFMEIE